jgi:hypothetical protein
MSWCRAVFIGWCLAVPGISRAQESVVVDAASAVAPEATLVSTAAAASTSAASEECSCAECQAKRAAGLQAAVGAAYAPLFYNNNFSYLSNPAYDDWHFGEHFKQVPLGNCWTLDLGGQYRARFMDEQNFRGLHLTGNDDDFLLHRTRLFLNARYSDWFRAYGEYIDAESNYENFPSRAIEVNRSDMLNLFADIRAWDGAQGELWFRAGRQELFYGSERLISPLDWANTRRTFEGYKFFWQGEDWNVDLFATRPVLPDPKRFDSVAVEQDFFGAWGTNKGVPGRTIDLFAIQFNNERGSNNFEFTTLGGRWLSSGGPWLWEVEGGTQFGDNTDGSSHRAGFATGGLGYKWADHCWKPQLWCYYDWASGGDVLGAGQGFNHLFPLAHKYLGFMDLFGRSNIQSPNVQLTCQPHQRLKLLAWYYYLFLDTRADTPYTVVMTPVNPGNAPASRDLGHEIDLLATITLTDRMDLLLGYSHFFSGEYYRETPGLPYRGDADFFYVQYHWNF